MWKRLVVIAVFALMGAAAVFIIAAQRRPSDLGLQNGQLRPCPSTPNCVSTQADPGTLEDGLHRAKLALAALPRTTLVEQSGPYLRAESRTESGIFADDVELLIDAESSLVHFRSASRIGGGDMGVNRARMEAFRAAWEGQ